MDYNQTLFTPVYVDDSSAKKLSLYLSQCPKLRFHQKIEILIFVLIFKHVLKFYYILVPKMILKTSLWIQSGTVKGGSSKSRKLIIISIAKQYLC